MCFLVCSLDKLPGVVSSALQPSWLYEPLCTLFYLDLHPLLTLYRWRTQSRVFPRLHLSLLRHLIRCWVTLLQGENTHQPCQVRKEKIHLSEAEESSFLLPHRIPSIRTLTVEAMFVVTSVCPLSKAHWEKFVNAVHISISVFKLDSCVSLGHPKVTHFSLCNFTHHRGAIIEFRFISLSFQGQICKCHYINTLL